MNEKQNESFMDTAVGWRSILIIALILILYLPTLHYDFTYDDFARIPSNSLVTEEAFSFAHIKTILLSPTQPGDLYRPLPTLSNYLNFLLTGLDSGGYHFINMMIHIANALLAFWLVFLLTASKPLSFLSATLFAVHPGVIEAVVNISGRAELLAFFFGILSVLFFLKAKAAQTWKIWGYGVICGVNFFLSTLSKESAFCFFPFLICLLFLTDRTGRNGRYLLYSLFLISFGSIALRAAVLGENFVPYSPYPLYENQIINLSFYQRIFPALQVIGEYMIQSVFPLKFSSDYAKGYLQFWDNVYSFSGTVKALVPIIFVFLLWKLRNAKYFIFGLWFPVMFLLSSNLIVTIGTIRADRLLYTPLLGIVVFLVFLLSDLFEKKMVAQKVRVMVVVLAIGILGVRSMLHIPAWQNNETLFLSSISYYPDLPKPYYLLGMHYFDQKQDLDQAEKYLREATVLYQHNYTASITLAKIMLQKNDVFRAKYWALKALKANPGDLYARSVLKNINEYLQRGVKSKE